MLTTNEKCELYDIIQACHNSLNLAGVMSSLKNLFNFDHYSAVLTDIDDNGLMTDRFVNEIDYPEEYVKEYTDKIYYRQDPVILAQAQEVGLLSWSDTAKKYQTDQSEEIFKFASNWDSLRKGVVIGDHTALSRFESCFISFAGATKDARLNLILTGLLPSLADMLRRIRADKYKDDITGRERELIRSLKLGGTNKNIADMMGCSEANVKKLSQSLVEKMDSMTKVSALATAMRLGID